MSVSRIASVAAVAGGLAWLVKVALIWGNGGSDLEGGAVGAAYLLGLVALAAAALAAGYAVVTSAPIWLRVVVSAATLVLCWMLFGSIDTVARALHAGDGWLGDELGVLVTAIVAVVAGLAGLLARRRAREPVDVAQPTVSKG